MKLNIKSPTSYKAAIRKIQNKNNYVFLTFSGHKQRYMLYKTAIWKATLSNNQIPSFLHQQYVSIYRKGVFSRNSKFAASL